MRLVIASVAALSLMTAGALAETNSNPNSTANSPSNSASNANQPSAAQTATAQKIKNDLQTAGFQDVNVAAESFLVQAKTKDGDPVVMTIGPHGMTMVEALGKSSSTSSTSSAQNGASSSTTSK